MQENNSNNTGARYALEKMIDALKGPIGDISKPIAKMLKAKASSYTKLLKQKTEHKTEVLKLKHTDWKDRWEERRGRNFLFAISHALERLSHEEANDVPPDEDWIYRFFDDMKDIGDQEMLIIWGNILAGEVARPGRYSPLTLTKLRTLTRNEAQAFTKICSYAWLINGSLELLTDVWDKTKDPNHKVVHGNFDDILRLESHGLVRYTPSMGFSYAELDQLTYFNKKFILSSQPNDGSYISTHASLTQVGEELLDIANGQPDYEYMRVIIEELKIANVKIIETSD